MPLTGTDITDVQGPYFLETIKQSLWFLYFLYLGIISKYLKFIIEIPQEKKNILGDKYVKKY